MVRKTDAVLLRSHPYSETSLVLRFLARELGVVGVMARGVRRSGRRGTGVPGIFDRGRLTIHYREGRGLQTLGEFEVERPGRTMGADLVRFTGASFLAELVLAHSAEEASEELFEAVSQGLDRLLQAEAGVGAEVLAAAWTVIGALGYAPELSSCVACGRPLEGPGMARFDHGAGGLRCPDCAASSGGPRVGPRARRELAALVRGDAPLGLKGASGHLELVASFATYHLDLRRPLRSVDTLRRVLRSARPGPEEVTDAGANAAGHRDA